LASTVRPPKELPCGAPGHLHASTAFSAFIVYPQKRPSSARIANADAMAPVPTVTPDSALGRCRCRCRIDDQPFKMVRVMRQAGAGYDIAIDCAKKQGMNCPDITV